MANCAAGRGSAQLAQNTDSAKEDANKSVCFPIRGSAVRRIMAVRGHDLVHTSAALELQRPLSLSLASRVSDSPAQIPSQRVRLVTRLASHSSVLRVLTENVFLFFAIRIEIEDFSPDCSKFF